MSETVFNMYKVVLCITISVICLQCWSRSSEIRDRELLDIQEFQNYLKLSQESDLFASTRVTGDIKLFNAGLYNEDVHLNVSQLIHKYGHSVEEHEVTTEDGYILTMIRIRSEGPAVFLMHGLLASADDWVTAGPQTGIAYLLANEGYDVWMGNARGTKHSKKHATLSIPTYQFWNFSWDEIGRYDLPAMIDYVLDKKNETELVYIGHSQGSTAFFVMTSEVPEYNDKISLMVALSAPTAIPNMKSPFLNFLKIVTLSHPELLFALAKELGFYEFVPTSTLVQNFIPVCGREDLAQLVCSNLLFLVCGFDADQLNVTNLPVIFSHAPSGAATKQLEHYSQTIISGIFRRFDYGDTQNIQVYGSKLPPEYPLEKVTAPVVIFHGENDWLVSFDDADALRRRLINVVDVYTVPYRHFNHIDYLFAKDLKQLVFTKLSSVIKQYNNKQ
ncbi:lipase 3-like [Helicoverpa armigera]|uniref:lipase 3-like n=1 Tax=Helicoverpa armigera TaxID=29058 RepID=UPI003082D499